MAGRVEDWLENSAFVDADGHPVTFYHGTDVDLPFNVFCRCGDGSIGFHFGSADTAVSRLRQICCEEDEFDDGMSVIPVICRATNPLRLPDLLCWETRAVIGAFLDAGILSDQKADELLDEDYCEMEVLYAHLEEAGYDAIVYRNATEGGSGDSLVVWRPQMLKSPFSLTFEKDDPRLLSQVVTDPGDLRDAQHLNEAIDLERTRIAAGREIAPSPPRL